MLDAGSVSVVGQLSGLYVLVKLCFRVHTLVLHNRVTLFRSRTNCTHSFELQLMA